MKSNYLLIVLIILFVGSFIGCEDLPSTGGGPGGGPSTKVARIYGVVSDLTTFNPVYNAVVYRTADSFVESTRTNNNGQFVFEVNLNDLDGINTTVLVKKHGYIDRSIALFLRADTLLDIGLNIDLSTSAIIMGVVRDSTTLFPLRNSNVLYAIPGFSENVVTSVDGAFTLIVDLVDRDSLPVTLTVSHTGFQTRQKVYTIYKGATANLGNVLLRVDQASSVGNVLGRVIDAQSRQPIINASVVMTSSLVTDSVLTTGDGAYSFSIDLQGLASLAGSLRITKNGYRSKTANFNVLAGSSSYNDVFLDRDTTTGVPRDSGTGAAHSIALVSVSSREITVFGVGGLEASILIWEVRDSLGFPIDIDHRDTVTFEIVGVPLTGGAYVSPNAVVTNVSGRVATTVNSGTVSGVLQFIAKMHRDTDGKDVISTPVVITVNAGLPDQTHFSIAAQQYNFAGYDWVGRTNFMTVQVGDKYSNPVKSGTAVYFNTTGGVIAASGFTDPTSHATVALYSGNPKPMFFPRDMLAFPASLFGDSGKGYGWIRAFTLGLNNVNVSDSILICFSGRPVITFSTDSIDVLRLGSQDITVTISDQNGNPLAPGTSIETSIEFNPPPLSGWAATASGLPVDLLDDYLTRGFGSTVFTLHVADGTAGGTPVYMPVVVTVKVTGPNGNLSATITGRVGNP